MILGENMNSVVCFGEALIDFLNIETKECLGLQIKDFRQFPGGAPANVAVAVARLGGKAKFAGQVGSDFFGDFLQDSLERFNVDTSLLLKHPVAKTALAFVTLDASGDRDFMFYRDQSADTLIRPDQVSKTWFEDNGIFHFCSNTLTSVTATETTKHAVQLAKISNNIISFDVNLRHDLWDRSEADIDLVNSFINLSDVVKFSKEEIEYLAKGISIVDYVKHCLSNGVRLLVITDGGNDIQYCSQEHFGSFTPPSVKVADTTAGGDGFTGGLLFGLSSMRDVRNEIVDPIVLSKLINFSAHCGAIAVTRLGAFTALPELRDVSSAWSNLSNHMKI